MRLSKSIHEEGRVVIDPERASAVVRKILMEQLDVDEAQLTRDADIAFDLSAEDDDLDAIAHGIEQAFHLADFEALVAGDTVGDLIDSVLSAVNG